MFFSTADVDTSQTGYRPRNRYAIRAYERWPARHQRSSFREHEHAVYHVRRAYDGLRSALWMLCVPRPPRHGRRWSLLHDIQEICSVTPTALPRVRLAAVCMQCALCPPVESALFHVSPRTLCCSATGTECFIGRAFRFKLSPAPCSARTADAEGIWCVLPRWYGKFLHEPG